DAGAASDSGGPSDGGGIDAGASDAGRADAGLRGWVSPALGIVGAAVDAKALRDDARYRAILADDFNRVTPENAMKWASIHPQPGTYDFADADALVAFAQAHGQSVRGHTLVWHQQLPGWMSDALTPSEVRAQLEGHIDAVVGRYSASVAVWDVVNEALDDQGQLRDTLFLRKLGSGYLELALRRARAAAPGAVLAYNDYDIETLNAKSDAAYRLVQQLKAAGAPIDAVGMQFHVDAYDFAAFALREADLRANIRRFAALGVKVHFTEVDVRVAGLDLSPAARLAYQAQVVRLLTTVCREEPGCDEVTFWGFADKYSWIDSQYGADDPLLYDDALVAKPAYQAVRDGLTGTGASALDLGLDTSCRDATTRLACHPFENVKFGGGFAITSSTGTLALSAARARRGGRSLRATAGPETTPQAFWGHGGLGALRTGTLYARVHVFVPSSANFQGMNLFGVGESTAPYQGVFAALSGNQLQLSLTTAGQYPVSSVTLPRDQWSCVLLSLTLSDTAGSASLTLDGAPAIAVSGVDTLPAGGMGNALFGITYLAPATATGEVFLDEAVVSTSPVGCN
ncbi:MAG: endo-1,4-beta-xylanase, partial [Myxococcaceae bacterium]|nr:endo-1,4-beta-xylanase [Myxococcaceae bacterium]